MRTEFFIEPVVGSVLIIGYIIISKQRIIPGRPGSINKMLFPVFVFRFFFLLSHKLHASSEKLSEDAIRINDLAP